MYITKMVCQAESFPSDIFHAALHMSFLPSGPYITKRYKTIRTSSSKLLWVLITTDKALDGYTHIVIDHHGWDTMYIPEKVTVGFHEGKRILMPEGEFYQFNLSSCIRQQNSLTAQFVSFSLSNLANIFYPPQFLQ